PRITVRRLAAPPAPEVMSGTGGRSHHPEATMSDDAVRQALATLQEGLKDWLTSEGQRDQVAREVASREGFLRELDHLRSLDRREPWQERRLGLLAAGAEADRRQLAKLREEQGRHEALTARLREAERIIFRFAGRHGLDAGPLLQLLVG